MRTDRAAEITTPGSSTPDWRIARLTSAEAIVAGGAVLASTLAFALLLGTAPARFMGTDDSYYLGIGANVFAGRGPVSVFGTFASFHAPLWPIAIAAPAAWFGADAPAWAHLLTIIGGASVIFLAGWFAWRAVPLAGGIAAVTMLAFPFMIGLGAGMGFDLPVAALCLAYLAVGFAAVRSGSIRLGALAGVIFALAFLTKEIALPFAPVPLLAALVRGWPFRNIILATAATLLVSLAGTSWWFVIYAQHLGTVYRIGTPWWTLIPIGSAGIVAGIGGLFVDRWWRWHGAPETDVARRRASRLGWLGSIAWAIVLTVMFARTPTEFGPSTFLVPAQVRANLEQWLPQLGVVLAVGLVGAVLEVGERILRSRERGAAAAAYPGAIDDLLIATICGFPLILLVVSVGEGPRHYIAQLALLVSIGATGWIHLAERCARGQRVAIVVGIVALAAGVAVAAPTVAPLMSHTLRSRLKLLAVPVLAFLVIGLVVWYRQRIRINAHTLIAFAMPLIVAAAVVLTSTIVPTGRNSLDRVKIEAIDTLATWVRTELPRGSSVVIGNGLAFELGYALQSEYRVFDLRDEPGLLVRPEAPLGVARPDQTPNDDWVAVRVSPTDVISLYGYRSSAILARLRPIGPAIFLHTEFIGTNQVSPLGTALMGTPGATVIDAWDWAEGNSRMHTTAFRIDPDRLAFTPRLALTPQALQRIVNGLEAAGPASRAAAADLVARVEVTGDSPQTADLLARLGRLASP